MVDKMEKDLYFVAVKAFIEDKEGRLFIFKDRFGDWDLPGGRLRKDDFDTPLEKVITRKIKEELGQKLLYRLEKPIVFMRHERNELLSDGDIKKVRIFAIGYSAKYLEGEPELSSQHLEYKWVQLKDFKPETYFKGGWLKGVKEYINLRNKI